MLSQRLLVPIVLALVLLGMPASGACLEGSDYDADAAAMEGWLVDSVTVAGNDKTVAFAILRELETRPGAPLSGEILVRDARYLRGLGLFADVAFRIDSIAPGRCVLRVRVQERSTYFLKTILPVLNYDFDKGFSYGVRWSDRNFRGRRERLYASYIKDADENDNVSMGWHAPWLGWHHVELGTDLWYFERNEVPIATNIIETAGGGVRLGIPLTESRMTFVQLLGSMSFESRRTGNASGTREQRRFLSPFIGFRLDSRDSRLRPMRGLYLFLGLSNWTAVEGPSQSYFRLGQDLRLFESVSPNGVIALQSNFGYFFGEYPGYLSVGLGGSGNLRGYPSSRFTGAHIWYQSAEWRYTLLPRKVFRLPIAGPVDILVSLVFFVDSGIVWKRSDDFRLSRFHGGAGFGLRIYSPFQDVVRIDLGFNAHGDAYPYVRTGIRF